MARPKRSKVFSHTPLRDYLRRRAAAAVYRADEDLRAGPPKGWTSEGLYDWGRLCDKPDARERLRRLDAGEPIIVRRWEIARYVELPEPANNFVVQPDDSITVAESEGTHHD